MNRPAGTGLLVALLVLLLAPAAPARVVELRHDILQDYQTASAVCGFAVGERIAVQFTPPDYPARLLKVRVLLVNIGLSLTTCDQVPVATDIEMPLEVFHLTGAVPGTSLGWFSDYFFSNNTILNEVDLNTANISIQNGSYLIAFTLQSQNASPAHDSSNNAHKSQNYIFGDIGLGANWYSFSDLAPFGADPKGDWVMRIDVEIPDQPQDGSDDAGGGDDAGVDAGVGDDAGGADDIVGGDDSGPGQDQTGGCTRDSDCTGGQVCDTHSGVCVQISCSSDADCVGGYLCRDNVCRKLCTGDGDCKGGESCGTSSGVKLCLPIKEESSCGCAQSYGATAGFPVAFLLALLVLRRRSSGDSRI